MAIAKFNEPTTALKANLPAYSPLAFDTFYKNTKNAPVANIATIMNGIPWSVDYFNQRLEQGQDAQFLDDSLSPTIQQYNAIANTVMYVQDSLTSSIDDDNKATVTGSALLHHSIRPIVGDAFTAEVMGGEIGLFKVTEAKQSGYNKDADTHIEYTLHEYVEQSSPLLAQLDKKSDNRYFYEEEELSRGNVPVISMEDHHNRINLDAYLQSISKDYIRDFYNHDIKTITIPNDKGILYDDYLVEFVKTIYGKTGLTPRESINRFTVRDIDISVTTIFSALMDRTRLFTDSITTDIGVISKRTYSSDTHNSANLIKYSPIEHIAKTMSPKYAGRMTNLKSFLSNSVLGASVTIPLFENNNNKVSSVVYNGGLYWTVINSLNPNPELTHVGYPGLGVNSLSSILVGNVRWINVTDYELIIPMDISIGNMKNAGFKLALPDGTNIVSNIRYPVGNPGYKIRPNEINNIQGKLWKNTSVAVISLPAQITDVTLIDAGLSLYQLEVDSNMKVYSNGVLWINTTPSALIVPIAPTEVIMRSLGFIEFVANGTLIKVAAVGQSYTIKPADKIHIGNSTFENVTTSDIIYDGGSPVPNELGIYQEPSHISKNLGDTILSNESARVGIYHYSNLTNDAIVVGSLVLEDLTLLGLSIYRQSYQDPSISTTVNVLSGEDIIIANITYQNVTSETLTVSLDASETELVALGLVKLIEPVVAIPGLLVEPNIVVVYDNIQYVNNGVYDIVLPNPIDAGEIINIGLERVNIDPAQVDIIKPVFVDDGYYVFSKEFYNSKKSGMSVLELLVFTYMKNDPIQMNELMNVYKSYKTWSTLQKLYFTPILMLLSDYVLSTYHSPWSTKYG